MPLPIEEIVDLALGGLLLEIRSAPPPLGGGGEGGENGFTGDAPLGYGGIMECPGGPGGQEEEEGDASKRRRRTGGVGGDRVPRGSPLWCEEPFPASNRIPGYCAMIPFLSSAFTPRNCTLQ